MTFLNPSLRPMTQDGKIPVIQSAVPPAVRAHIGEYFGSSVCSMAGFSDIQEQDICVVPCLLREPRTTHPENRP